MEKDIVYIFRHGKKDDIALKYSLRSLKNFPHRKVWIIGDRPWWLSTTRVSWVQCSDIGSNKALNAWHKLLFACGLDGITEDFVLFNDDFLVLSPVTSVPYYCKPYILKGPASNSVYHKTMHNTITLFEGGMDYELHYPLVYNKEKLRALDGLYTLGNVYLHRSLYCNHYKVGGEHVEDNKVSSTDVLKGNLSNPHFPYVSTADRVEKQRDYVRVMAPYFRSKSIYER